jgi:thiol-disulfide isomerase/thioredoxin
MRALLLLIGLMGSIPLAMASSASFDATQLAGEVVYLDFWASWCKPCRESFPWMNTLNNTLLLRNKGLVVVAVNVDQQSADADAFLSRYPANFRVVFDPDGKLAEQYKVTGMPSSVILDRQGAIRFRHVGFHSNDGDKYITELQQLLNEK